jgi:hypothetical protein
MAEKIISAGVFTRENDLSFVAQGVSELGAVVIGPTEIGPAFIPTVIRNGYNEFVNKFGNNTSDTYVPQTVNSYLNNASSITVVRVLGNGGWSFTPTRTLAALVVSGSGTETSGYANAILAVFHPSKNTSPNSLGLEKSIITPTSSSISGSFILSLSGSGFSSAQVVSASLKSTDQNFITKTLGKNEFNSLTGSTYRAYGFPYILFRDLANATALTGSRLLLVTSSTQIDFTASIDGTSYAEGYAAAMTPWVTDGNVSNPARLFRFAHLSHGFGTNQDVYASITDLVEPADVSNVEQYSTFTVLIRRVGDSDKQPVVLETYGNVNLNPDSPNFIARVIGDRYYEYDTTLTKVVSRGNYSNSSQFVRVIMGDAFGTDLTVSSLSPKASPRGFERLYQTITGFTGLQLPPINYVTVQNIDSVYNPKGYLGFDFTSQDNYNYLKAVPTSASIATFATGSNFSVNTLVGHPSSSYTGSLSASVDLSGVSGPTSNQVQFSLAMQGGSDGINPATLRRMGSDIAASNVFGYDLSSTSTAGARAFNKAINILANVDEYDFNLLTIPGILKSLHSAVTSNAINMVSDRGDAFYIMDLIDVNASVAQAANATSGLDSSYTGVYYPWVKILDSVSNRPIFVPPSVVMPGVFANNDKIAGPWFAAAGFNRGGLGQVIETKNKLSQPERDILYTNRVNPIAQFPGQGVVVWGQKTLQVKASSLDRINVRRLLIELKKFVSRTSRNLVFDQNTLITRNRFLNIVNPYLESVQQRQGLYAYRVQMDDTNNTSDVIDRNQLVGAVFLQPTKTAEFIIIDFNLTPTGATFPS